MRAGAIDIGSNSILLTIAEARRGQRPPYRLVVDEAHVTGLAKGLGPGALIQPERLERSLNVLKRYKELIQKAQPDSLAVVATEALRKAKNGEEVRREIEKSLEYPVALISGDREAELSFWSCQREHPKRKASKLIFDIGGASTEICVGVEDGILERTSLKVGSVLLSEKFQLEDSRDPREAIEYVRNLLNEVPWTEKYRENSVIGIGVAGTITTLLAMEKMLVTYDRAKVHLQLLPMARLQFWLNMMASLPTVDRAKIPGLSLDRADVFLGGLSIAWAISDFFGWNDFVCMDTGVRFGLISEAFLLNRTNS